MTIQKLDDRIMSLLKDKDKEDFPRVAKKHKGAKSFSTEGSYRSFEGGQRLTEVVHVQFVDDSMKTYTYHTDIFFSEDQD